MGSVGQAAKAVGMGRRSVYRPRERAGACSFAAAWDRALAMGRTRQFSVAMDRALNGITTVRVLRGGAIDVRGGPDMDIVRAALPHHSSASSFGFRTSLASNLSILRPSMSPISNCQPVSPNFSPSFGKCLRIASACPAAVA